MALRKKEKEVGGQLPAQETETSPETAVESTAKLEVVRAEPQEVAPVEQVEVAVAPAEVAPPAVEKDPRLVKIEEVMSGDMKDVYMELPQEIKPAFRLKGEEVATSILEMMAEDKLKPKAVLKLMKEWYGLIPSKNKSYSEKGAKIKAEKIMALAKEAPEVLAA